MFTGFPEGKQILIRIPSQFFNEILPGLDYLPELKLMLYVFWRLELMEGPTRYLLLQDIVSDETFMRGLQANNLSSIEVLQDALERSVARGVLLRVETTLRQKKQVCYFLNSPKGRAAVEALDQGKWSLPELNQAPVEWLTRQQDIFSLYEENIGPLTPLLSDAIHDAEATYPEAWIKEAITIAAEKNKRSWNYIKAVLKRWQEEGRYEREDRQDIEKDRRRYIEGKYSHLIKDGSDEESSL
jgi:DNA replication protein